MCIRDSPPAGRVTPITPSVARVNRGGVKAPGNELYILLCNAYEMFCKIEMSPQFEEFLRLKNPRDSFVSTLMYIAKDKNCVSNQCQSDHDLIPLFAALC